jgi:hypothetical protein
MAARRLVIVMLVLLGVSTLLASLAPPPGSRTDSSTTTASPGTTKQGPKSGGELVRRQIDAQASRPEVIEVPAGDQLALEVSSDRVAEIEIGLLGLLDTAAPLSPARFDVFAEEPGSKYTITLTDDREQSREIGEIRVQG